MSSDDQLVAARVAGLFEAIDSLNEVTGLKMSLGIYGARAIRAGASPESVAFVKGLGGTAGKWRKTGSYSADGATHYRDWTAEIAGGTVSATEYYKVEGPPE